MELTSQLREPRGRADRWFLRSQGRTIGPLEIREVKAGLQSGVFQLSDKAISSSSPQWQPLERFPEISGSVRPRAPSVALSSPPPPRHLRKTATPPPLPVFRTEPEKGPLVAMLEPIPEPAATAAPQQQDELPAPVETAPAPEPEPVVAHSLPAPPPEEPEEIAFNEAELEAAIRGLEKVLAMQALPAEEKKPEPTPETNPVAETPVPARPDFTPVFIAEPVRWGSEVSPVASAPQKRVIQIELKVPERPWRVLILVCMVIAIGYVLGTWQNKTRDLKDSRLPDPSSPTTAPLEAGDPIPPLKAPTRPQRE